mmetsp:Transcript_5654/g.8947  ORF Transcript_5654/g.8947 Transcript_5654/m.8947 type:complete len:89 (+) Transcript_5654:584-850(+)
MNNQGTFTIYECSPSDISKLIQEKEEIVATQIRTESHIKTDPRIHCIISLHKQAEVQDDHLDALEQLMPLHHIPIVPVITFGDGFDSD